MPHDNLSYLTDILEATKLVTSFIQDVEEETFYQDVMRQSAVIRQIEIIGEATKRLSAEFRATHPDIRCRQMAGMRDILVHAYDHVDVEEVWHTATDSIPQLTRQIKELIAAQ